MKREQVVTTIGELIEAKTEVANIVVDVLSSECFILGVHVLGLDGSMFSLLFSFLYS